MIGFSGVQLVSAALLGLLLFPTQVFGFYYYSNGGERRCFQKELTKGTYIQGKYRVSVFDTALNTYQDVSPQDFGLTVDIEEIFDDNQRVVHQKGSPMGDFTFVALESGEHRICLQPQATGWLSKTKTKVELEFEVGSDAKLDSKRKKTMESLQDKVNMLSSKVMQIKLEQQLMRDREAQFRDLSENVNSRAMWWAVIQIIVLATTCVWQMKHLGSFFVKQKVL
ncbi:Erp1p KNAG_0B05530 [Huiozyma naganishii CBS 8797]|uniref:GOLD domain-containing protein n=1 Tax=Huiozyma naganishii (strain ATCC MYA-139 / BCRC 22969 / CBS 8797 / KCTC 17520 / NBRC 10181 / NCYC 3082 / Yp74L-3) TaxID=1071383 RepID=J7S582_HUIN7|nr:hypothetical protein KNAG_0B05530 [Kazachstania naganishii CBS 8797]CCK68986.1 hypothetical protein KNAG_0B05530 [Kazachstania naganishii CBS 8797]